MLVSGVGVGRARLCDRPVMRHDRHLKAGGPDHGTTPVLSPETGEIVPIALVTDNGGSFRSFRFEHSSPPTPKPRRVRTRVRTPGQNGVHEQAFPSLKYEPFHREQINDALEILFGELLQEHVHLGDMRSPSVGISQPDWLTMTLRNRAGRDDCPTARPALDKCPAHSTVQRDGGVHLPRVPGASHLKSSAHESQAFAHALQPEADGVGGFLGAGRDR